MEVIDVGSISVEKVLKYILTENHLKKLVQHNSTACFVLAHQMLNPRLYETLIENSDTIDATTREFVDFIVFYGNKSGITKVNRRGRYQCRERTRIEGLSLFSRHGTADIDLSERIEYNSDLANELRYNQVNTINERHLSHQMTRGASILMDFFELNDSLLPSLLFVNPNNLGEYFTVKINTLNPIASIYLDILKPISICFHEIKEYYKLKNNLSWNEKEISNAKKNKDELPSKIDAVQERLNLILLETQNSISNLEAQKNILKEKLKKFSSEVQRSDIREVIIDIDLKDDPNSIIRLNLVLERVRNLEKGKEEIENGNINYISEVYKQLIVANNSNNLKKYKNKLNNCIKRIEEIFTKSVKEIESKIANEKSEYLSSTISNLEIQKNILKEKFQKLLSEVQRSDIREVMIDVDLKDDPNSIIRLNLILERIRNLENEKEEIENGNINYISEEHKQLIVANNLKKLRKDRKKLNNCIKRIEEIFTKSVKEIESKIANEKSEYLSLSKSKQRMENELLEAQEKLSDDYSNKLRIKKERFITIKNRIKEVGIEKEVFENSGKNSYKIIENLFNKKKSTSKIKNMNHLTRDLFICHASQDKDQYVIPFTEFLKSKNISIWYDESEIRWGDSIVKKVNEGLRISKFVLVVLSKNTIDRNWQNSEIEASLNTEFSTGKTRVLPLIIGNEEEVDYILSNYPILASKVYINYSKGFDFIYELLKERLGN